jgi:hypothetical protein
MSTQTRIEFTPLASRVSQQRQGKRERMLARLRQGPATTWEMNQIGGSGFSARINELRVELRKRGGDIIFVPLGESGTYKLEEQE